MVIVTEQQPVDKRTCRSCSLTEKFSDPMINHDGDDGEELLRRLKSLKLTNKGDRNQRKIKPEAADTLPKRVGE